MSTCTTHAIATILTLTPTLTLNPTSSCKAIATASPRGRLDITAAVIRRDRRRLLAQVALRNRRAVGHPTPLEMTARLTRDRLRT